MTRIPPNPQRIRARAGKRLNGPTSYKKVRNLLQLLANLNLIQEAHVSFKRPEWGIWVMGKKEWKRIFDDTLRDVGLV